MERRHLISEKRPDSKGNLVTRWVRPDARASSEPAVFPAPSKPAQVATPVIDGFLVQIGMSLKSFDPRALRALDDVLVAAQVQGTENRVRAKLREALRRLEGDPECDVPLVDNLAVLADAMYLKSDSSLHVEAIVKGLKTYPEFMFINDLLCEADETQQEQARALAFAASNLGPHHVESDYTYYRSPRSYNEDGDRNDDEYSQEMVSAYLHDQKLASLIMEHPDRVERIVDWLRREPDMDVDRLREIIQHDQQAVAEGLL